MSKSADIKLGIVRGISYGLFGRPDEFVPQVRALGCQLVRLYFYWGQIEREPGRFDWSAVDAFLAQLDGSEEVWVTVCSSSPWATDTATTFLPPSPAKDDEAYAQFVHALVKRCAGRVQYWQCNNEPSNVGLLWSGTAADYVHQLRVFQRAVRAADRTAQVVLGGCGYDVLSSAADSPARVFFDHVLEHGKDAFDLFAVHLYDDPNRIPAHIESVRAMMRRHGDEKPVVVGEYNGPTLFEFPELETLLQRTVAEAFVEGSATFDAGELTKQGETPDRRAMRALYDRMADLPPQMQMFMEGCSDPLAAKRHRINCREIVVRNLLALSTGVTRTVCWNLAPEVPDYKDPYNLMGFLSGKLALMDYEGKELRGLHPAAETFRLLAHRLADVQEVVRLETDDDVTAIALHRRSRPPSNVLWRNGDAFAGEDEPARPISWPWPVEGGDVVDAFGQRQSLGRDDNVLRLNLSVTPVFVTPTVKPAEASPRAAFEAAESRG